MVRIAAGRARAAALVFVLVACSGDGSSARVEVPTSTLGMRVGSGLFDGEAFERAERWLGAEISYTVQFVGRESPHEMNGSAFGLLAAEHAELPRFADRLTLSINVPLGFGSANAQTREGRAAVNANLLAVAGGEHDDAYRRVARRLVEAGFGDAIIRLGHEFSGAWSPWSSRTNEDAFIAAWRHVHGVLRTESPDFEFDWTAMRPSWIEWGEAAYPGDEYVDIVGLDVYWRAATGGSRWDTLRWERQYVRVLRDHLAFAVAHGKQLSYPEWGISGADLPQFIDAMYAWFGVVEASGDRVLRYQAYFNHGGEFSLDHVPDAKTTFRDLFGTDEHPARRP